MERVLRDILGPALQSIEQSADMPTAVVVREGIRNAVEGLREHPETSLRMLVDLTGIDYRGFPGSPPARFAAVYHLTDPLRGRRVRLKAWLPERDPSIDSIHDLYGNAPWLEREAYDMFGIVFRGHPKLDRILMPDDFRYYPLRKDYPLQGRGERMNFPVLPGARPPRPDWTYPPRPEYDPA